MIRPGDPSGTPWKGALFLVLLFSLSLPNTCIANTANTPDSLSNQITDLRAEGRYVEALDLARDLHSILQQDREARAWQIGNAERLVATLDFITGLPAENQKELAEADALDADIQNLDAMGKYGQAAELAAKQVEIRRRFLGERHAEVAESRNALASQLRKQRKFAESERVCREALRTRRELLGPGHPDVAESLHYLGTVLWKRGHYAVAESLMTEALDLRRSLFGEEHEEVARSLNNLASLYQTQGNLVRAESFYRRALEIHRNRLGAEHPETAALVNNLALVLSRQGGHAQAEVLLREVLALRRRLLGAEHPHVARSLGALAHELSEKGDLPGAESLLREALAIRKKVLRENHPEIAVNLLNLCGLLRTMGKYEEAKSCCREGLDITRGVLGDKHPRVAMGLYQLGALLAEKGELEDAEALFREALEIGRQAHGDRHLDVALFLIGLAYSLMEQGELVEAGALFREALAIEREILREKNPLIGQTLHSLGCCLLAEGDLPAAESVLSEAADVFETARELAGDEFTRPTFLASPYWQLAAAFLEQGRVDEAWPVTEKALSRALADNLMASGRRPLTPVETAREDSLREALGELERRIPALHRSSEGDTTGEAVREFDAARNRLLETEAMWIAFQGELTSKYPTAYGGGFPLERIQAGLADRTAIVGWLSVETRPGEFDSWAYAILESGPVRWAWLPRGEGRDDVSPVETLGRYRESLELAGSWPFRVTDVTRIRKDAQDLCTDWIEPLIPALDHVEHLIVIPLGPMLGIPVESLIDSRGRQLGDRYVIAYAPSATVHTWLRERASDRATPSARKALLLGDPAFSLSDLPPLPRTREEIAGIESLLSTPVVLVGEDASEERMVRMADSGLLKQFDTIHLATHALVDGERPERSALVLSRVDLPDPLEAVMRGERIFDGVLTVKEIAREWDLDADLVTLSACQTALGTRTSGEGYVGFAHAFFQAGARSLLVSLWKVDDEATRLLMGRFYENLTGSYDNERGGHSGGPMSKAEALQEAKHWLRTYTDIDGQQPFRHPTYWSGFVLVGNPD